MRQMTAEQADRLYDEAKNGEHASPDIDYDDPMEGLDRRRYTYSMTEDGTYEKVFF